MGARRRRGRARRRCCRNRLDVARGARSRRQVHRDGDSPEGGRGRRDRGHPRERPRADERADDGKPPRPRRAWPCVALGAGRFRRRGAAVHGHDDDGGDARASGSRDAGAARHRVELTGGARLPIRNRRAEGSLPATAREGRDHGRGRDDRAAGGIGRRPSDDDRDAAPGRLLDPSGSEAVHLRGPGRPRDRARPVRCRFERPRRSRDVHRRA